jgi:transcription elongation factor GreA
MKRKPLTQKGSEKLRAELRRLKAEDRPRVIQAIAEARAHGDLSENAEYHAAREQQGFIEGRIKLLEHELSHAEIIDVAHLPASTRVVRPWTSRTRTTERKWCSRSWASSRPTCAWA